MVRYDQMGDINITATPRDEWKDYPLQPRERTETKVDSSIPYEEWTINEYEELKKHYQKLFSRETKKGEKLLLRVKPEMGTEEGLETIKKMTKLMELRGKELWRELLGEREEPFRPEKLDFEEAIMEKKYYTIISMPINELQPLHVLDILQIKKFVKEKGKEDWLKKMEEKEKEYYEEISDFVETANKIIKKTQQKKKFMTMEKVECQIKGIEDAISKLPQEYKPNRVGKKLIIKEFLDKIILI